MIALAPSPLGSEALDDATCPASTARATLRDIAVANAWFGGRRAAWYGVRRLLRTASRTKPLTLLDVGAGGGDVARYLVRRARDWGFELRPLAVDLHPAAVAMCREQRTPAMQADVAALPFRRKSVDIVLASQFLHHFARESARELLGAFERLARVGVVVADLRRSRLAAWGIWLAATSLRFHPVSRADGMLSVRRGFTASELERLLKEAGLETAVHRRPGFRLVASWRCGAYG